MNVARRVEIKVRFESCLSQNERDCGGRESSTDLGMVDYSLILVLMRKFLLVQQHIVRRVLHGWMVIN